MSLAGDERPGVFINCPFDHQFKPLFNAIAFTVLACGFRVRNALEAADSGELRLEKIFRLIEDCSYSIHDLSRVELDRESALPRFNMPIELGIALGFKRFAMRKAEHRLLIMDARPFRYQSFASDLAGLDIPSHGGRSRDAIRCVRDFLAIEKRHLPSPNALLSLFSTFEEKLPELVQALKQDVDDLTFVDRVRHAEFFLEQAAT